MKFLLKFMSHDISTKDYQKKRKIRTNCPGQLMHDDTWSECCGGHLMCKSNLFPYHHRYTTLEKAAVR